MMIEVFDRDDAMEEMKVKSGVDCGFGCLS